MWIQLQPTFDRVKHRLRVYSFLDAIRFLKPCEQRFIEFVLIASPAASGDVDRAVSALAVVIDMFDLSAIRSPGPLGILF
jgi:hypothetical protein